MGCGGDAECVFGHNRRRTHLGAQVNLAQQFLFPNGGENREVTVFVADEDPLFGGWFGGAP